MNITYRRAEAEKTSAHEIPLGDAFRCDGLDYIRVSIPADCARQFAGAIAALHVQSMQIQSIRWNTLVQCLGTPGLFIHADAP